MAVEAFTDGAHRFWYGVEPVIVGHIARGIGDKHFLIVTADSSYTQLAFPCYPTVEQCKQAYEGHNLASLANF